MSKILSRFLSVLLSVFLLSALVIPCVVSAADPQFYAVGSPEFFEWGWNAGDSRGLMTLGGDGKYSATFNASGAQNAVNMKVVEDTGSGQIWHGDGDSNVVFDVKGAGTIIITYDPSTKAISISGTAYAAPVLQYSTVAVAGNGEGTFLNGESWNEKSTSNMMTQVSPDVWEIEYFDVPAKNDWQVKFVLDSSWNVNFGGTFSENGVETDAYLDGGNIFINTAAVSNIKLRLDLSHFDLASRSGAKFTVTVTTKDNKDAFYVVGTDPLGGWDKFAEETKMAEGDDGKYTATFAAPKKIDRVEMKVVKLTGNDVTKKDWYGDAEGNNVAFGLSGEGRFTVTFDPATNKVEVSGDVVTEPTAAALETGDAFPFYIAAASLMIVALIVTVSVVNRRRRIEF